MDEVVDLLDGLLLMSLRIGHGRVYVTPSESCLGVPIHLITGFG